MSLLKRLPSSSLVWSNLALIILLIPLTLWALHVVDHPLKSGQPEVPIKGWSRTELFSIHEINLRKNEVRFNFQKNKEGIWIMTRPEFVMANQLKVHTIMSSILSPNVERLLDVRGDIQSRLEKKSVQVELKFNRKRIIADIFRIETHGKHDFIRYHEDMDHVYKVIREAKPDISLDRNAYRTKRIFPFNLNAIDKMSYQEGGLQVDFHREGNQLKSKGAISTIWEQIFKQWQKAGGTSFVEEHPGGEVLASYTFSFVSGEKSKLELVVDVRHGFMLFYVGRHIGQTIEPDVKNLFFPQLSEASKSGVLRQ